MSKSINNRLAEIPDPRTVENLRPLFEAIFADLTAINSWQDTLRTKLNADAGVTDTNYAAPTALTIKA